MRCGTEPRTEMYFMIIVVSSDILHGWSDDGVVDQSWPREESL